MSIFNPDISRDFLFKKYIHANIRKRESKID